MKRIVCAGEIQRTKHAKLAHTVITYLTRMILAMADIGGAVISITMRSTQEARQKLIILASNAKGTKSNQAINKKVSGDYGKMQPSRNA